MEFPSYNYSLGITSQFYFCGIPLRLDSYSSCLYSCDYCFASARGGKRKPKGLQVANPEALQKRFSMPAGAPTTAVDEMLENRQPIHFGGMSDPFPPIESKLRTSLRILEVLSENSYPVAISTKGTLAATSPYIEQIRRPNTLIQFSFATPEDALAAEIEMAAPPPSERVQAIKDLIDAGVNVSCRLQPLIPGREGEASEFIAQLAEIGVRHVSVEYLKLPLELTDGIVHLSRALDWDLRSYYRRASAIRVGREWILPVGARLPGILQLRERAHESGLLFGAADTDLLPLSDGNCCCSGFDEIVGGEQGFHHNYLGALRRADDRGRFSYRSVEGLWAPTKSIGRMVNSRSRLSTVEGSGAGLIEYIRWNWNGRENGCSPAMFYGVDPTDRVDSDGFLEYSISEELNEMLRHRMSDRYPNDEDSTGWG